MKNRPYYGIWGIGWENCPIAVELQLTVEEVSDIENAPLYTDMCSWVLTDKTIRKRIN